MTDFTIILYQQSHFSCVFFFEGEHPGNFWIYMYVYFNLVGKDQP